MNQVSAVLSAAVLFALPAAAQPAEWYPGPMGWAGGMMFGGLSTILFWGVVIAVVAMIVRRGRASHPDAGRVAALNILRERFARGEIGAEEYQERKKLLAE